MFYVFINEESFGIGLKTYMEILMAILWPFFDIF